MSTKNWRSKWSCLRPQRKFCKKFKFSSHFKQYPGIHNFIISGNMYISKHISYRKRVIKNSF